MYMSTNDLDVANLHNDSSNQEGAESEMNEDRRSSSVEWATFVSDNIKQNDYSNLFVNTKA